MSTDFYRGPLTGAVLTQLETLGKPVGDGVIPAGAAWEGQPNNSTFVPFLVLSTLTASRSGGPIAEPQADWLVPYLVQSFGASRDQCEWMADRARSALDPLEQQVLTLGPAKYAVQQVHTDSLGAINRVDVTDPPIWGQQDHITVWLGKEYT